MNTEQCAGGREIKQIGSETEQSEINWQVCGNLDTKVVFLVSEWKKDYLNDIEAIDTQLGGKVDLYINKNSKRMKDANKILNCKNTGRQCRIIILWSCNHQGKRRQI